MWNIKTINIVQLHFCGVSGKGRSLMAQWSGQEPHVMIQRSWVRTQVRSNLGYVVLLSKSDMSQKYIHMRKIS